MNTESLYNKINNDYYVIFGLSYCGYCIKTKKYLKDHNKKYKYYEIDKYYKTFFKNLIKTYTKYPDIKFKTEHKTYPVIFYKGKFIGGYIDLTN
jgi:glutaredoxin